MPCLEVAHVFNIPARAMCPDLKLKLQLINVCMDENVIVKSILSLLALGFNSTVLIIFSYFSSVHQIHSTILSELICYNRPHKPGINV